MFNFNIPYGQAFFGMQIKQVDDSLVTFPKMQLSPEFANMMPPEFVAKTNAWLKDFFGTERKAFFLKEQILYIVGKSEYLALQVKVTP